MAGTERDAVPGFVLGVALVVLGTLLGFTDALDAAGILIVLVGAALIVEAQIRS